MSQNSASDRWNLPAAKGRKRGRDKDTTEMPQKWVKVVNRNRPSQQRNVG